MIQQEYTDPICCTSDRTLLLSHIIPTSTTASQSKHTPLYCNWKIKVPHKVQVLEWIIAQGTNTGDMVQRRRPYFGRSPHWFMMCKAKAESGKHLLNFQLLLTFPKTIQETMYDVQNPASCVSLLSESHRFFQGKKRGNVLGKSAIMSIFWVILMERNRNFRGWKGEELVMCERGVPFLATLLALVS